MVVIGSVSRLSPTKGQIETIRALARLDPDGVHTRLVLVGCGEIEEELRSLAVKLGVADRVVFAGLRNDIPELLGSFDVFAHPSFQDPCPLAVLEAQAAALPTVAFDEGGISEIVTDEVTGLLAPDRDVNELAQRMQRLIDDPELRNAMGAAARDRTSNVFGPARSGSAFFMALRELV
jgi:glycosyltransferase involved in cell wall biosynthesis